MARAGDQGQRHGVDDVGADNARGRRPRIQHDQRGNAERASADRRDRDQDAEQHADDDGRNERGLVGQQTDTQPVPGNKPAAEDQGQRRQQQRDAEDERNEILGRSRTEIIKRQEIDGCDRRRHAAQRQAIDNPPIDIAIEAMNQRADRLGRRGIQQIGADGRRRMNTEE